MKKLFFVGSMLLGVSFFVACGGNDNNNSANNTESTEVAEDTDKGVDPNSVASYDPHRGEGKFNDFEPAALNKEWAASGKQIYEAKCQSCHKLTDERLVGPGWAGVTERHTGAWLLNFITNPDAMLDQDPELLKQIEICMVRMPNQNIADNDAKEIYDFMRQNDGAK